MRRALVVAGAAVVLLGATPQEVATRVAQEIVSPFCPGVTLHDCPSAEADELRREIAAMASSGMSRDEIVAELRAEYGPGILATPENPIARALPWAAAVAGLAAAALLMSRFAARGGDAGARRPISSGDRTRLDTEFDAFKRNEFGGEA